MEKLTKSEQGDMNTFKEENYSKTVEKKAVIVEEVENAASTSGDLIVDEIDEATVISGNMKPSNLEIEAALSNVLIRDIDELSINLTDDHAFLTICKLADYFAEKTSIEAQESVLEGQALMETISSAMEVLQSSIRAFSVKASEASECGTNYDYKRADFYYTMASKYESFVEALENRARRLEIALNRVEECRTEC